MFDNFCRVIEYSIGVVLLLWAERIREGRSWIAILAAALIALIMAINAQLQFWVKGSMVTASILGMIWIVLSVWARNHDWGYRERRIRAIDRMIASLKVSLEVCEKICEINHYLLMGNPEKISEEHLNKFEEDERKKARERRKICYLAFKRLCVHLLPC